MNRNLKNVVVIIGCLMLLATQAGAGNARLVRSAIFPGMGQLGDGQTGRGLLYMGGEAALLTLTFTNVAKHAAYVRKAAYDSVTIFNEGGYAEAYREVMTSWQENNDNASKTKTMAMAFGGAALAWWAWNIVDGFLFTPPQNNELSFIDKIRRNTVVAVGPENASVSCSVDF